MGISSYTTTPSLNTAINGINIAEGCNPSSINDAIRQLMADIATDAMNKNSVNNLTAALNFAKAADIASAATTDIGAMAGNFVNVTGTTTITALGTAQAGSLRKVRFTGALTLTHNATSLILPGAANIVTSAGDVAEFISLGSGNWACSGYLKANGVQYAPLDSPAFTGTPTVPTAVAGTSTNQAASCGFVNGTPLTLANGSTAVTQAIGDTSTKVATMAALASAISALPAPDVIAERLYTAEVTGVQDVWTQMPFTRFGRNTIGASISSGNLVLPAGTYYFSSRSNHRSLGPTQTVLPFNRIYDLTHTAQIISQSNGGIAYNYVSTTLHMEGVFTLTETTTLQMQYYHSQGSGGLGPSLVVSGVECVPLSMCVWKVR